MAILKGFPPSNMISTSISIPEKEGESVVIDDRDPLRCGRVMLGFGTWAYSTDWTDTLVPSCGTKVKWWIHKGSDRIWYGLP